MSINDANYTKKSHILRSMGKDIERDMDTILFIIELVYETIKDSRDKMKHLTNVEGFDMSNIGFNAELYLIQL